jgi:hypothetical protein
MDVYRFVWRVLSGRGLCEELITCPEESYRLWHVVVCDYETSWYEEAIARAGLQRQSNKQQTNLNGRTLLIIHVPTSLTVNVTASKIRGRVLL